MFVPKELGDRSQYANNCTKTSLWFGGPRDVQFQAVLRAAVTSIRRRASLAKEVSSAEKVVLSAITAASSRALAQYAEALRRPVEEPRHSSRILSVLIKPVSDRCNLECVYCYEGTESQRYGSKRMSEETLERLIVDILASPSRDIEILWHGGEPLLAGIKFFAKAMEIQARHNVMGKTIRNRIQTNGLLLDDQWLDFLQRHGFTVGISVDGPQDIHDRQRIGRGGIASFDRVANAIRSVQRAGIPFGAIGVITDLHRGRAKDTFRVFQDLRITSYDLHPNVPSSPHLGRTLSAKDYSDFMNQLADEWLESGSTDVRILTFDEFFRFLLREAPSVCYYAGKCTRILAVEADGNVVPCTRPFDRNQYTFGNILSANLESITSGAPFTTFSTKDQEAQARSATCQWFELCHNGCPQHRIGKDGMPAVDGANIYCTCQSGVSGGNSAIWQHLFDRILGVLQGASNDAESPHSSP